MVKFKCKFDVLDLAIPARIDEKEMMVNARVNQDIMLKLADFGEFQVVDPYYIKPYEGATEITPSPSDQTLNTYDRHLKENIIVKAIPFSETSNLSGGYTINIG